MFWSWCRCGGSRAAWADGANSNRVPTGSVYFLFENFRQIVRYGHGFHQTSVDSAGVALGVAVTEGTWRCEEYPYRLSERLTSVGRHTRNHFAMLALALRQHKDRAEKGCGLVRGGSTVLPRCRYGRQ